MRKHHLWTPLQVRRLTREVKETLDRLIPEYQQAHDYCWGRRDSRTDENQGHRISSSGKSDPTGDAVAEQEENRRRLGQACRKLEHAAREVDAAHDLIKSVFSAPDDYLQPLESYRP